MCANTGGPLTNQQQECFMATAEAHLAYVAAKRQLHPFGVL